MWPSVRDVVNRVVVGYPVHLAGRSHCSRGTLLEHGANTSKVHTGEVTMGASLVLSDH